MFLFDTKKQMAEFRQNYYQQKIALVPTMGGLHEGHLALINKAKQLADKVVVSIFINPAQFSEGEDLISYPRNIKKDIDILRKYKIDAVFMPSNLEMNSKNSSGIEVNFNFAYLSNILCAKYRKNFLSGVAKVICQLFNIIQPNIAIFGQKDYQQLKMIESLVFLLNYPIKIVSIPTLRAKNNLALSSRNQYLSKEQKEKASLIYDTLIKIESKIHNKKINFQSIKKIENSAKEFLEKQGFKINYLCLLNYPNLLPISHKTEKIIVLVAVFLEGVRLIDNWIIKIKN